MNILLHYQQRFFLNRYLRNTSNLSTFSEKLLKIKDVPSEGQGVAAASQEANKL